MSYYWKGSDGSIYEVNLCPSCKGAKEVNNMFCRDCQGHGVVAQDMTCSCSPARGFIIPFDKDCPICWGSGIKGYRSSMPPTIRTDPWWK
jgi:hypothetical protein